MRLFLAITPPDLIRQQLGSIRADIPRARWVPPANMHVTLRFIGEVNEAVAQRLQAALTEIRHPSFQLRLERLGTFGRPPRTLWVGLEPAGHVRSLAAATDEAAQSAGLEGESRPFRAHLTLARLDHPPPHRVKAIVEAHEDLRSPPFHVGRFELVRSHLGPEGPRYEIYDAFELEDRGAAIPDP